MTLSEEIQTLEQELYEKTLRLNELKKNHRGDAVPDYTFETQSGPVKLSDCFGDHDRLLVVHNMGQGCRYCTLWGDGINALLPHLESAMSVMLVSGDSPETQRSFANSRGWRFRLASHAGTDYISEQNVSADGENYPGAVVYQRENDGLYRKNAAVFGPGDLYCAAWNLLALGGVDESNWTPQYRYWQRPEKLSDGGENILD